MFCPKCGNEVKEGLKFCPKCGSEFVNKQGSVQQNYHPNKGIRKFKIITLNNIGLIAGLFLILLSYADFTMQDLGGFFPLALGAVIMFYTKGK